MFTENVSILVCVGCDMQENRTAGYIIFGNETWTWISIAESIETVATHKMLMSQACLCCQRRKYSIVIVY
jgi:hypothetical protein